MTWCILAGIGGFDKVNDYNALIDEVSAPAAVLK
jgi:hypothetical protein